MYKTYKIDIFIHMFTIVITIVNMENLHNAVEKCIFVYIINP